jgi:hypothetical protein
MRLIGTAVAMAAAIVLVTAGTADAKRHRGGGGHFKFCVQCPVVSPTPWSTSTCSAKGKTRDAARATCQMQNNFCYVRNYSKKTCK